MKTTFLRVSAIALSTLAVLMMASCQQSYQKKAEKFKQKLGGENIILAEVIDSTAQKIFYHDTTSLYDDEGNVKDYELSIYDIATQKTTTLKLAGVKEILSAKQYASRLFFSCTTDLEERFGPDGDETITIYPIGHLLYYDLSDDSIHYVKHTPFLGEGTKEGERDIDVTFLDNEILVTLHVSYSDKSQEKYYHILPNLSDSEYQTIVKKMGNEYNELESELMIEALEEWESPNELANSKKIIHIEFDLHSLSISNFQMYGVSGNDIHSRWGGWLFTDRIRVPSGKQWICKEFIRENVYDCHLECGGNSSRVDIRKGLVFADDDYFILYLNAMDDKHCKIHIEFEEKPF